MSKDDDGKPDIRDDGKVVPFKRPGKAKAKGKGGKTKAAPRSATPKIGKPSRAKSGAHKPSTPEQASGANVVPMPKKPEPVVAPLADGVDESGRPYHSAEQVRAGLRASNGKLTIAAAKLGITYGSLTTRLYRDPDLAKYGAQLRLEHTEQLLDIAEVVVGGAIRNDPKAALAFLDRKGGSRGYKKTIEASVTERPAVNAPGDDAAFAAMNERTRVIQLEAENIRLRQKYEPEAYRAEQEAEFAKLKAELLGSEAMKEGANEHDAGRDNA